jgi:hypothetical protein
MKKRFILFAAIAILFSSCNLVEDMFDGSDDRQSREFRSEGWSSVERNVFTVQSQDAGKKETMSVVFPDTGEVAIYTDNNGNMSLLFKSYQVVEPSKQPDDWDPSTLRGWVKSAFEIDLLVEDVPYKVTKDGKLTLSPKTVRGILKYCHYSSDNAVFYKSVDNCKVSITGDLTQDTSQGYILYDVLMKGDLEIKIISQKSNHNIMWFKELTPSKATKDYLDFFKKI